MAFFRGLLEHDGSAVVVALVLGLLVGWLATRKRRNFLGWWALGTVLFLPALIVLLVLPNRCTRCGGNLAAGEGNVCRGCRQGKPAAL